MPSACGGYGDEMFSRAMELDPKQVRASGTRDQHGWKYFRRANTIINHYYQS